ncbi:MAG: ABC transporter permease [candidate division WOR-3 bacterium]
MDILTLFKTALGGLIANKMRSFLTTLGVIIGVTTVIAMVSIIEGINGFVYNVLGSVGSTTLYVQKFKWDVNIGGPSREEVRELSKRPNLTPEDAEALRELPCLKSVGVLQKFLSFGESFKLTYKTKSHDVRSINGVDEYGIPLLGYQIEQGRNFTSDDINYRRQVVILGKTPAEKLFGDEDPLEKEIQIAGKTFMVIGVLGEKGKMLGNDMDDFVVMPMTTAQRYFELPARGPWRQLYGSPYIAAQVKEGWTIEEASEMVRDEMRMRRGIRFDQPDNFEINSQKMLVDIYKQFTMGIFLAMIGIASLALLVGGIGIMNIMLVSVTERTKEIGIRMAIGATRWNILLQFLFESVTLTLTGGIIGILLGLGLGKLVDILTPLPSSAPLWSILLGLAFAAGVGLFFGIYPAYKASCLDPIEALRYE